ncbi:hypothetical protein BOX37_03995 [Nocardia mangyaensis]|uniref:PPE domain-containing protein n=1 Tax=Nocardia mangyaensis TaxID=2213200 RepID=A0A1J0VML1_9NOCA|nr:PPE domain-containing protein [Nocardia mangyaensis]APE33265.1 hypothetical protein BOX37_03995 [Nocardia mangyaensis]
MIEPPQEGFTGVVWEARPPEKLAGDLTEGPGAAPLAAAGAGWARLAVELGSIALEYQQTLDGLRAAWNSAGSSAVLAKIEGLQAWLTEMAAVAAANAARAETQAAAYEVARLAMPNHGEIAAIRAVQDTIEQVGALLGAPVRGVGADNDAKGDIAHAAASRVMRGYESATEPLAQPWPAEQAPVIAPPAPLAAERASAAAHTPMVGPMGPVLRGITSLPTMRTAYHTPVHVQGGSAVTTTATVGTSNPVPVSSGHLPMAPGAMGAAAAGAEEEHTPRAGVAVEPTTAPDDHIGILAAPAVLGVPDAPIVPESATERTGSDGDR